MLCVCASRAIDTTRTREQSLTSTTSEYLYTPIMLYVNTTDYVDFALFTVTRHIIILTHIHIYRLRTYVLNNPVITEKNRTVLHISKNSSLSGM